MLGEEVQAGGYRVNAECLDPPKSHVCVPTMTIEGESYRRRVAEAKQKSTRASAAR